MFQESWPKCGSSPRKGVKTIAHIDGTRRYVSSRKRAQETLSLLLPETRAHLQNEGEKKPAVDIEVTDAIREWDYGDYEGLTSAQIKETRERNGQGPWDIWSEGCPGGE